MDICEEIEKAEKCLAVAAAEYAEDATYGNETEEQLYGLMSIFACIQALENNLPRYKKVKKKCLPATVSLSCLKKQNNTLILDIPEHYECSTVECRNCLSDSEICSIAENVNVLCRTSNCG